MESHQIEVDDYAELVSSLSDGFEALLQKVEDLALRNADLRREVQELRLQVGQFRFSFARLCYEEKSKL